jgi:hypothetical protein
MIGTSSSITAFPLSSLGCRRSIRNGKRNIPESDLVSWALLNGEHVSELLV